MKIRTANRFGFKYLLNKNESLLDEFIKHRTHRLLSISITLLKQPSIYLIKIHTGLLIMEDFNHPDIKWTYLGGLCIWSSKLGSREFIDLVKNNFLIQHVHGPTFTSNTLNLVINENSTKIFQLVFSVCPLMSSSNHNYPYSTLTWNCNISKYAHKVEMLTQRTNYRHGNYIKITQNLDLINWLNFYKGLNIETMDSSFCLAYSNLIKLHIPMFKEQTKIRPKWFNSWKTNQDISKKIQLRSTIQMQV